MNKSSNWLWLVPILGAGLVLRLWGIGFGLPSLYNADEGFTVRQALLFGAGVLQPYTYVVSPFMPYIVTVLYGAYFLLGLLTGRFHSPSDLAIQYFNEPTLFYLLARLVSVVFGMVAIGVAYLLAKRAYGRGAGLLSAAGVALSPVLVRHAHYGLPDVPAACLLLVALYALFRFVEEPSRRRFVLAGVLVGLAIVMKYYSTWALAVSFTVAVFLAARHEQWPRRRVLSRVFLGGLMAIGTFAVVSPYTVLDFDTFWADAVLFQLGTQVGYGQALSRMLAYYASALALEGLGLPLAILALVGLAYAIYRRRSADLLLIAFVVPYMIVLLPQGRAQLNWIVSVVPVLAILGAAALDAAWRAAPATWRQRWPLALLLVGALVWPAAERSGKGAASFSWPDTRTLALTWIEANIAPGAKIVSDPTWTVPQLRQNRASLTRSLDERATSKDIESRPDSTQAAYGQYARYQLAALDRYAGPTYDLVYIQHEWWKTGESVPDLEVYPVWGSFEGQVFSLQDLRAQGYQYAVVSSLKYAQYLREGGQELWPSYYAFYSSLDAECRLLKEFWPDGQTTGPVIKVYDLQPQP